MRCPWGVVFNVTLDGVIRGCICSVCVIRLARLLKIDMLGNIILLLPVRDPLHVLKQILTGLRSES